MYEVCKESAKHKISMHVVCKESAKHKISMHVVCKAGINKKEKYAISVHESGLPIK
jgi:hypothetical protein